MPDHAERRQPVRGREVGAGEDDGGRRVVDARGVARRDGEALDLRVQHLQPAQPLHRGALFAPHDRAEA
jgi:hypothetical protein